jgi:hypothetical protein
MKSRITNLLPENKREKCPTLSAILGNKVYSKELQPGCVIEIPEGAQLSSFGSRSAFTTGAQPAYYYAREDRSDSAYVQIFTLPIEWAGVVPVAAMHINRESPEWGDKLLSRLRWRWQMPKQYDGHIKVLAPSLSEYLGIDPFGEGSSHAAA